ncbi:hypothetical protein VTJ04DRAFT_3720 [Mycothermus thermophilus]|uniref:uncharacterized protein n=1 Tax=Humicola insolens TaxID=85995 RepID=UPI0037423E58
MSDFPTDGKAVVLCGPKQSSRTQPLVCSPSPGSWTFHHAPPSTSPTVHHRHPFPRLQPSTAGIEPANRYANTCVSSHVES